MSHGQQTDGPLSEINVTPLVDVMLVLLIVLMVTASTAVAQSIDLALPKAASGKASRAPLSVEIDRAGGLRIDQSPIDVAAFERRLTELAELGQAANVVLAADEHAEHRHLVHALDLVRRAGIEQVAIGVLPEPSAASMP